MIGGQRYRVQLERGLAMGQGASGRMALSCARQPDADRVYRIPRDELPNESLFDLDAPSIASGLPIAFLARYGHLRDLCRSSQMTDQQPRRR